MRFKIVNSQVTCLRDNKEHIIETITLLKRKNTKIWDATSDIEGAWSSTYSNVTKSEATKCLREDWKSRGYSLRKIKN